VTLVTGILAGKDGDRANCSGCSRMGVGGLICSDRRPATGLQSFTHSRSECFFPEMRDRSCDLYRIDPVQGAMVGELARVMHLRCSAIAHS
jgi:hypothetical protein